MWVFFSFFYDFFIGPKIPVNRIKKIFFGIGNPGSRYADTRHNIGFAVVDRISGSLKNRHSYHGNAWGMEVGEHEGVEIALVKPKTFVNVSGEAFADILRATRRPLSSCVVIVDDYHLPVGSMRLRPKGSDGGHNGLKSIIEHVGEGFARLRIGIGPLPQGMPSVDFVLGTFDDSERTAVNKALLKAEEALLCWAHHGIESAMSRYNG